MGQLLPEDWSIPWRKWKSNHLWGREDGQIAWRGCGVPSLEIIQIVWTIRLLKHLLV